MQRLLPHVDDAADAVATLMRITSVTAQDEKQGKWTYMHVVEAFVDLGELAVVGDVLVNLDLALEVV